LKEDIHINVLDSLKFSFTSLDLPFILFIFGDFNWCSGLSTFWVWLTTLSRCCLRIGFGWCRRLSRSFLFLFLLVLFFRLRISAYSS
jgi:hypothetical protein